MDVLGGIGSKDCRAIESKKSDQIKLVTFFMIYYGSICRLYEKE